MMHHAPRKELVLVKRGTSLRSLIAATLVTVMAVLPAFMTGALAVFMQEELGLTASRLGMVISAYYAAGAALSLPAGRAAQRLGQIKAMTFAVTGSAIALSAIALAVQSWSHLLLALILAGLANAVAQPAANLAVADGVPLRRQGVAFGLKQAAVPTASMLAGAAVPLFGATLGWRWAYAAVVPGILLFWAAASGLQTPKSKAARPSNIINAPTSNRMLVLLAVGGCFAVLASSTLGSFFVVSAVAGGVGAGTAGLLMATGSGVGILARIIVGWFADRRAGGNLRAVVIMLIAGAGGFLMLATHQGQVWLLIAATFLAYGWGWGWAGLYHFAVIRQRPDDAAAATGIIMTGMRIGGILGPVIFGLIADRLSFEWAWTFSAGAMLMGAVVIGAVRFSIVKQRTDLRQSLAEGEQPHNGEATTV